MRTHERYRDYALLHDAQVARDIIAPDRLVAVRYEPVMAMLPEAMLDLTFERDGRFVTIANVYVLNAMLEVREAPPVVWPRMVRAYGADELFEAIEERIEPWLTALMLGAHANDERVRVFTGDAAVLATYERARALGLYGAAPLVDVMRSVGPYVYGYRFVRDRSAVVADAAGANGAALLYGRAKSVAFDAIDAQANAIVRRWFGAHRFEGVESRLYDVAFVGDEATAEATVTVRTGTPAAGDRRMTLAHPVPMVSLVSLDVEDSVPDRTFGVHTDARVPLACSAAAAPAATGGSGGRVMLLVRDDLTQADDADTDAVNVLSSWLGREGFTVTVARAGARLDPADTDIVHVIGHRHVGAALPFLERCAASGVPIVAAPYADDPLNEYAWGAPIQLVAHRNGQDAEVLDLYADAIARRRLLSSSVDALPNSNPVANPELARLLAFSGVVIASGPQEERLLRELYAYGGPVLHVPAYQEPIAADGAEALVGLDDFILLHTPIDPASALLSVLAAAVREGLALVWTGPVADHELLHYVRAYGSENIVYVPPALLTPAELEGLYSRARVYVDVSWAGHGLNRIARAASYGAAVVGSIHGYAADVLGESCYAADPGSSASIASALRAAWSAAPHRRQQTRSRAAQRFDGVAALVSTVTAYSQAAAPIRRPSLNVQT